MSYENENYGLFGSLKGGRVEGRKVEQNGSLYLVWMFLKLIKEKRVINIFFYLDILKIRKERRGND